jgi:hypothetical protein
MTSGQDEALWRNRFILLNLVRIGGTIIVLLGLLAWHGDVFIEGGSMLVGFPATLIGLFISFWGPKYLSRRWRSGER